MSKYCLNCKAELLADYSFCPNCGFNLQISSKDKEFPTKVSQQPNVIPATRELREPMRLLLGVLLIITFFVLAFNFWSKTIRAKDYDNLTFLEGPIVRNDCYQHKKRGTDCYIWILDNELGRKIGIVLLNETVPNTTTLTIGVSSEEFNSMEIEDDVTYYIPYYISSGDSVFLSIEEKQNKDRKDRLYSLGFLLLILLTAGWSIKSSFS